MPIIVKDFTWKQTTEHLNISVPLKGAPLNRVDIFTSPRYIKVTFQSYFFEVVLLDDVDIAQSKCLKTPESVIFDLKKCVSQLWSSLEVEDLSKEEKLKLKLQLIEEARKQAQEDEEKKRSKTAELKRVAINDQINLDTEVRKQIEENRQAEKEKALGNLDEWKSRVEKSQKPQAKPIKSPCTGAVKNKPKPVTPKPRDTRSLQILFTAREFPTPLRESRQPEELEFLAKQAEARRTSGFVDEDLRPEEKNPDYLLAKGLEFLRHKNYLGALSALSFAIKLSPNYVELYFRRSEVHMLAGNFGRAAEDCSKALELYVPRSQVNLHQRAVCLGRRGVALFKMGFATQGISELEASLKLEDSVEFRKTLEEFEVQFKEQTKN